MARRKSEVYWEERSVEAKLAGIKDAEAYAKRLAKAYEDAARAIESAVEKTLADGWRTADIFTDGFKRVGTDEVTEIICKNL